ncbi:MAG: hypothetical protein ACREUF_16950, partial [Solimonas sp.]
MFMFFFRSINFLMFPAPATSLSSAKMRRSTPAASLEDLRRLVTASSLDSGQNRFFSFGLPVLDKLLPRQGLSLDSVH